MVGETTRRQSGKRTGSGRLVLDTAEIVSLRDAGLSIPGIADRLGVSKERAARRLKRIGKSGTRAPATPSIFLFELFLIGAIGWGYCRWRSR
jgi:hypothetical protein